MDTLEAPTRVDPTLFMLDLIEKQRPCKKRRTRLSKHAWELWPEESILNMGAGEFRSGTVLRCLHCHVWFEPAKVELGDG